MNKSRSIIRLPEALKEYIDEMAEYKGISRNALILEALWQYIGDRQAK